MSQEKAIQPINGYAMLATVIVSFLFAIGLFIGGAIQLEGRERFFGGAGMVSGGILFVVTLVACGGFFTLLPNEACVVTLFGSYIGTAKNSGFWWVNPFNQKRKISQRSRNLEGAKLKVNDKQGNPIEIAVVVVWRVEETAQACFDVENYEAYVRVQSESAVRHLANSYAYDHGEQNEITLRSGYDEVSAALRQELQERLSKAGVHVEERG